MRRPGLFLLLVEPMASLFFGLVFGADGGFGGLEADATVRSIAEGLVHGAPTTAEREVGFTG